MKVHLITTCKIFKCSERSLKRWIEKYCAKGNNTTLHEPIVLLFPIKLHKDALQLLKENELQYQLQKKHKTLDISPQHLGTIIR
jgi:hypothetical protein